MRSRAFAASITGWRPAGDPGLAAASCHLIGQVQRAQGRLDAAAGTYQQAVEVSAPPSRPAGPVAGIGYVGMAEVAYRRGELDTAVRDVTEVIALCRQFTLTPPLAAGLATLAWIRQANGDAGGALDAMEQAGRARWARPWPACSTRCRRSGRGCCWPRARSPRAARWIQERGLGPDDEPGYPGA